MVLRRENPFVRTLRSQIYIIMHRKGSPMFESKEESLVLDIVCGFFDISSDEMMQIGDMTKNLLFDPGIESEEAAVGQLKAALKDMSKEHALITGMFISGFLRCNLAQQIQQQYAEAMAEGGQEPE